MTPPHDPSPADDPRLNLQRLAWQSGERVLVEDYLRQDAGLARRIDVVQHLICQEYILRQGSGENPVPAEYYERFPKLKSELRQLFWEKGLIADPGNDNTSPETNTLHIPRQDAAGTLSQRQVATLSKESSSKARNVARNVLFGILAIQQRFVKEAILLQAFHHWKSAKSGSLGELLKNAGKLSNEQCVLLNALVEHHLQAQVQGVERGPGVTDGCDEYIQAVRQVADDDIQRCLRMLAIPHADTTLVSSETPNITRLPRFQKLRFHAKGGLGEVHVAKDSELNREVALKEIQSRHADEPRNQQRFRLEAEITGGLEHPGIVPVYGLGTYADRRPFYAMRFIRGDSLQNAIREYHSVFRRDALRLRQLLRRFSDVCNAMQYAHDRGILHRDLKPGNIMLGKYGETMVVDWGLAKLIGDGDFVDSSGERPFQPLSGDSVPTEQGSLKGTPAYMSPEQASGEIDRLTFATDIYSLGATLYHLLTGQAPFTNPDLLEALQMIREGKFQRPSVITPRVPRPLEAICLKAMSIHPEDRYSSARQLTEEIDNWLADETVAAYREPLLTRARRWMRKHPGPATGLSVSVMVGLLAAGGLAFVNGRHAQELTSKNLTITQQNVALAEANENLALEKATAEAATNFLISSFRKADPSEDGRTLTVYSVLSRAVQELENQPDLQPAQQVALLHALGESFSGLGLYREAVDANQRALKICREHFPGFHPDTSKSLNNLGTAYVAAGQAELAITAFREALQMATGNLASDDPEILTLTGNLAAAYEANGQIKLAIPLFEESLKLKTAKFGENHLATLAAMNNLGHAYEVDGNFPAALKMYLDSYERIRRAYGDEFPQTLIHANNLANGYRLNGQLDRAMPLYQEVLRLRRIKLSEDHPHTLTSMNNLAYGYECQGDFQSALPLYEETLRRMRAKHGNAHPSTHNTMINMATALLKSDQGTTGSELFDEFVKMKRAKAKPNDTDFATTLAAVADRLTAGRQHALAEAYLRESLSIRQASEPDLWTTPNTQSLLGASLAEQEKYAEAEPFLLAGYEGLRKHDEKNAAAVREEVESTLSNLVKLYSTTGRQVEAAGWQRRLDDFRASGSRTQPVSDSE